MPVIIRKLAILLDETHREMGRDLARPIRRVVACAVIENPFAGRYVGGKVSGVIGRDRDHRILLVADRPAPGLGKPETRRRST